MGRPSRAGERKDQILRAAARSIVRHGLADLTLERIAEESGLSRSHVRHYLGNRDELMQAVWEHVMTPYRDGIVAALAQEDAHEGLAGVIDYLFGPELQRGDDDAVAEALLAAAVHDSGLRAKVFATYQAIEAAMASGIRAAGADRDQDANELAYSVLSLAIGWSTLSGLPFPESRRRGARHIARALVGLDQDAAGATS